MKKGFVYVIFSAWCLSLILGLGLSMGMAIVPEPVVDFSSEGRTCKVDIDCAPSADFEGIHAICINEKCEWTKYITTSETMGLARLLNGLFIFTPLSLLIALLIIYQRDACARLAFGRSSKKIVFLGYGGFLALYWLLSFVVS